MKKTKRIKEMTRSMTAIILMASMVMGTGVSIRAEEGENGLQELSREAMEIEEMIATGDASSNDNYISIDEEGNVELIPMTDVILPDYSELEELEEVEYHVISEEDGKEAVVEVTETLEEAEQFIEDVREAEEKSESVDDLAPEANVWDKLTDAMGIVDNSEMSITAMAANSDLNASSLRTTKVVSSTVSDAVVVFIAQDADKDGYLDTTYFTNKETGAQGYLSAASAPDAAYLGMENGKVKFMQSGVIGLVDANYVNVVAYEDYVASGLVTSIYTTSSGKLYHKLTTTLTSHISTICVGYQQDYMNNNATYYSYDGHYFYSDYRKMIADYQAGTYKNSINASSPYFNYYQYLSHRTKTNFTAEQIEAYIVAKTNTSSKLRETGSHFVEYQNTYGANAVLMLGVAINESGYGTSSLAMNKNNLFGHAAADSNPYYGANGYGSVEEGIKFHADYFISGGYCDTKDFRYYGPNLGDKQSGMNVKYASDPYWGEKAASHGYYMEDFFSDKTYDYGNYKVGVTEGTIYAYNSIGGTALYNTTSSSGTPTFNIGIVILDTLTSGGVEWYKIQSDSVLNASRTSVDRNTGVYDFEANYLYVKASNIDIKYDGAKDENEGSDNNNDNVLGDVSGDSIVAANDYLMIKDYIMGIKTLTSTQIENADVTGDGVVAANDYLKIKDYIMGVIDSL